MIEESQIQRDITRARELRAEFIVGVLRRAWDGLLNIARKVAGIRRRKRRIHIGRGKAADSAQAAVLVSSRPNQKPRR